MKQKLIFIIFLLSIYNISWAQMKSKVNESFELTSIVFRLAGAKEYGVCGVPGYARDIDEYFAKYDTHKIVDFIKEIKEKYHIAYDAVANAAALIEIKNHKVQIKSGRKAESITAYDNRWSSPVFKQFISHLNNFYKTTKFDQFFLQHSSLYKLAEERMNKLIGKINIQWFESFFGEKLSNVNIVASICNGPHSYAFALNSNDFGIVIGSGSDREGLPFYGKGMISLILHEINHSFTDKCLAQIWKQIDSASLKIYPYVEKKMYNHAYGNAKVVISEWLTNLYTLMYFRENPIEISYEYLITLEMERGFIWMERSANFMNYFYKNREIFKTINNYISEIAGHINFVANHFPDIQKEFDNRHPYVVNVFPANYTSEMNIDTIEIKFSEPMLGSEGIHSVKNNDILPFPIMGMTKFKDPFTYIIPINKEMLQAGKTYGIQLDRNAFQSKRCYPMAKDFIYTFITPTP